MRSLAKRLGLRVDPTIFFTSASLSLIFVILLVVAPEAIGDVFASGRASIVTILGWHFILRVNVWLGFLVCAAMPRHGHIRLGGRMIREFIFGVLLAPTFFIIIWVAIFGWWAIALDGLSLNARDAMGPEAGAIGAAVSDRSCWQARPGRHPDKAGRASIRRAHRQYFDFDQPRCMGQPRHFDQSPDRDIRLILCAKELGIAVHEASEIHAGRALSSHQKHLHPADVVHVQPKIGKAFADSLKHRHGLCRCSYSHGADN
jgi:hypothetical protein